MSDIFYYYYYYSKIILYFCCVIANKQFLPQMVMLRTISLAHCTCAFIYGILLKWFVGC